ncbi:hypothetical protein Bca4012_083398 [Brassica carinata]
MAEYNKLSEVTYNTKIRSWSFRVKLHRIYPFYSYVTNSGPYYNYILADEDVSVISSSLKLNVSRYTQVRIIEPLNNRLFFDFKSIHAIPLMHWCDLKYPIVVFNTEAHLDAPSGPRMEFYIRDNIDHQIKCVVTSDQTYAFRDGLDDMSGGGRRQVIVVLKMWRACESMSECCYFGPSEIWLETEGGFADFRLNPRLPEVEEFRQSLLNSDPYVQKYGVEGVV